MRVIALRMLLVIALRVLLVIALRELLVIALRMLLVIVLMIRLAIIQRLRLPIILRMRLPIILRMRLFMAYIIIAEIMGLIFHFIASQRESLPDCRLRTLRAVKRGWRFLKSWWFYNFWCLSKRTWFCSFLLLLILSRIHDSMSNMLFHCIHKIFFLCLNFLSYLTYIGHLQFQLASHLLII